MFLTFIFSNHYRYSGNSNGNERNSNGNEQNSNGNERNGNEDSYLNTPLAPLFYFAKNDFKTQTELL